MRILSFQLVNSEKITGILEEEGGYYRFYLLCNGDSYMRRLPVPGPLSHKEFKEFHRKMDPWTKFHPSPVEIKDLTYDNLREIYHNDISLHANEPIGGFPEPATPHPDLMRARKETGTTWEERALLIVNL